MCSKYFYPMRFLLAAAVLLAVGCHAQETANKVVCYYTNWSVYRKGEAKYLPTNINPYLCTHLVYAFGGLTDEFEVGPFDSYQDIEQGGYAKFNGMKQYNKGLKTLLALGGWNEGSRRFSELVAAPETRKTFITSVIRHLRRYNFDGLDLDWEYPAARDGSTPEDKPNYALLVKELRDAFEQEGRRVKKGKLLLTMAISAGQKYIDIGFDIPSLTRDLDFFNVLNYDYHSAYEPTTNHHSALFAPPGTSEYEWNANLNVDWTTKYLIELGADKHKIVLGIPTYGRSYTLLDGNFTDFGASADGPGLAGKYTKEKGFMAFYEVCENIASHGWEVRKPYPRRIGPYAFSGNQWVGYDDEKIAARKAQYVRDQGLGGIMFWSLDSDDFRGICNGQQYPLIESAKKALFSGLDTTETTKQQPKVPTRQTQNRRRPSTRTTTTTTTTTTTPRSTRRPTRRPAERRRRPDSRRTTRPTPTIDPLNTPAPPTTPSPVSSFSCKREGFYPNPKDCHKYYWCLDSGASGLGIVAHAFTCPSDLVFNKVIDGCDHPDRTKCNTEKPPSKGAGQTTPGPSTAIPTTTELSINYDDYYDYYGNDDEYYYDDYYNYDYDNELPGVTPEKTSDNTAKKINNSPGNQFQRGRETTSSANRAETESTSSSSGRTRPQYSSISRDRTRTPSETTSEQEPTSRLQGARERQNTQSRPQYTSIQRERPATTTSDQQEEQAPGRQTTTGERVYVTIERQRPTTREENFVDTVNEGERVFTDSTEPTLQYVTINRGRTTPAADQNPSAESLFETPTTPRYVTIQRNRPSTVSEDPTFFEETTFAPTTPAPVDAELDGDFINYDDYYYYGDEQYADSDSTLPNTLTSPLAQKPITVKDSTFTTHPTTPVPEITGTATVTHPTIISSTTSTPELDTNPYPINDTLHTNIKSLSTELPETEKNENDFSSGHRFSSNSNQVSSTDKESEIKNVHGTINPQLSSVSRQPSRSSQVTEHPRRRVVVRKRGKGNNHSQQEENLTTRQIRIRPPRPTTQRPTVPPAFRRPRPNRPQTEAEPQIEVRPTRFQVSPRPTRPQNQVRFTRPNNQDQATRGRPQLQVVSQDETNIPLEDEQPSRPVRPFISLRPQTRPTEPSVALEEDTVSPQEDELFDTTIIPETTEQPIAGPITVRPRPTTPVPKLISSPRATPQPTTSAPQLISTLLPRPRPTTARTPSSTQTRSRPRPRLTSARPRLSSPRPTTPRTTTSTRRPPVRSPRPSRPATIQTRPPPQPQRPASSSILSNNDYYDYYYDDLDGALTGTLGQLATFNDKATLMADGSVQCYDTGYFAHPDSCKKFISCSKTVRGLVRGWVYTCPDQLVFDPVGGMCNWAEAVDCAGKK